MSENFYAFFFIWKLTTWCWKVLSLGPKSSSIKFYANLAQYIKEVHTGSH